MHLVLPHDQDDVRVRRLRHDDAESFAAGTADAAVQRYGHLPLDEYTPEVVRGQIDGVIADGLRDGSLAVLAIADANSDEFLGSIVLFDVREGRAEVGFWLAPWARGRGVAQRALRTAGAIAVRAGLSVLDARTALENDSSRKVLEAAGFRQVGEPTKTAAPSGEVIVSLAFELSLAAQSN